ncbi:hypothetical protein DPMN_091783 [Dreissena polymorpha]|uniref:Uncharacterized protein n=1 Tax=Dreissena polymorpha TaxID=45954 RepID=A0A9D4L050_DREPO|nr:hypothetical protein DPMN_091783 [Dreissena polymorpha]
MMAVVDDGIDVALCIALQLLRTAFRRCRQWFAMQFYLTVVRLRMSPVQLWELKA